MNHKHKNPIVMTLDAGGTNFVFSAVSRAQEYAEPVTLPANSHDLELCLKTIIRGFESVRKELQGSPDAISFAFPGPADYLNGIIGDLGNLPAFRGGVPLGPMLEDHFQLPVFINNDGDLFTYGEAMHGFLPELNRLLEDSGSRRRFRNLVGLTLGTGFGGGIVRNNELFLGDNGAAGEVWLLRNSLNPEVFAEEHISARAVTRGYLAEAGENRPDLSPLDVYRIAVGQAKGNRPAAMLAFRKLGEALGSALADVITVIDGPVVIGGGLSNAWQLFFPDMLSQLNGHFTLPGGKQVQRLELQVFNVQDPASLKAFLKGKPRQVKVPFSDRLVSYDPVKSVAAGVSKMGTSKAVALGAYAFALNALKSSRHE
jgi:glucokinase